MNAIGSTLAILAIGPIRSAFIDVIDHIVISLSLVPLPNATIPSRIFILYPVVVVIGLVSVAVTSQGPVRGRLRSLGSSLRFLLFAIAFDAAATVAASAPVISTVTYVWLTTLATSLGGIIAMLGHFQSSFTLPRPHALPFSRRRRAAIPELFIAAGVATGLAVSSFVLLAHELSLRFPATGIGILFSIPTIPILTYLFLHLTSPRPKPGVAPARAPALSVIMPAYNETSIIASTLEAIDRAAANYPGSVEVVVADDGSTDGTRELVEATFGRFRHAFGSVVVNPHRGKAATLNAALDAASSEIVVRIDADTRVDTGVFLPLPGWFANPRIGMVGSLDLPDPSFPSWYSYGRLFECLRTFAFGRPAQMRVNGIICVPGTYSAFRGEVAKSFGGFVEGMNGEDADLTIVFERLGYDVVIDTDIIIYEDVPKTWGEFRKQRVRWQRGGIQLFARHFGIRRGNLSTVALFSIKFNLSKFEAVVHPILLFGIGAVLVTFPNGYSLVLKLLILLALGNLPSFLLLSVLAIRHGFGRKIPWMVVSIPFGLLKRLAALEAIMSLPSSSLEGSERAMLEAITPDQAALNVGS